MCKTAELSVTQASKSPERMQSDVLLEGARIHHQSGNFQAAEAGYRQVLAFEPENPMAIYGLSLLHFQSGRYTTAEDLIRKVIELVPDDAQPQITLGTIKNAQGDTDAAIESYTSALKIMPANPDVLNIIGSCYRNKCDYSTAIDYFERVVSISPASHITWTNLGDTLWKTEQFEKATDAFRRVTELMPGNADAWNNLGKALQEQDYYEEALECFGKAVDISHAPGDIIRLKTTLPIITESVELIDALRAKLDRNLELLIESKPVLNDPLREIDKTNFIMAYHGHNDREFQMKFARLYANACPDLVSTATHCTGPYTRSPDGKIRIGFISRFFKNYSISRSSKGIIEHLSRDLFHVIVIFPDPPQDEMGNLIKGLADEAVILPRGLENSRKFLADMGLDILFYQDIGMDVFTYFLAFSRLAPVQCTSFGHPVTSGIPALDYYITTEDWEPEDGDRHYSEKLLRLRGVSSVAFYDKYYPPDPLQPREHFGLNDNVNIYICPQTLFKFHPEFDAYIQAILQKDPDGRLVLVSGKHRHWQEKLYQRFTRSIPDVADRISFQPKLHSTEFRNLIAISNVMLDTIHFCGFNTSLDAFAAGTPVVTQPGKYMRSRHTASFYYKMGISDCTASTMEEYVDIAHRLGTDATYREEISRKIGKSSEAIWGEWEVVREFERIFTEAVAACTND